MPANASGFARSMNRRYNPLDPFAGFVFGKRPAQFLGLASSTASTQTLLEDDMVHHPLWIRLARVTALAVPLAGIAAGCDTFVHGQLAVPDSNQRLAAGADGVPSKQVWVIENWQGRTSQNCYGGSTVITRTLVLILGGLVLCGVCGCASGYTSISREADGKYVLTGLRRVFERERLRGRRHVRRENQDPHREGNRSALSRTCWKFGTFENAGAKGLGAFPTPWCFPVQCEKPFVSGAF